MDFVKGEILLINKDKDWTSFDVVNKTRNMIKKKLNIKKIKVGHAGTLDPKASGLLIVCTGKMTKKIDEIQNSTKEYIAKIYLGATTPSFDSETEIDNKYPTQHITKELVENILKKFIGKQMQTPPLYSALKINGQRAYKLARKGEKAEIKAREIEIYDIEILNYDFPEIIVKISCSKGTYIRALARDLGTALNSGAYLSDLVRTASGNYKLDKSLTINELEKIINNLSI